MNQVQISEVIGLLRAMLESDSLMGRITDKQVEDGYVMITRLERNGIAPPDGLVLVPIDKLNEVHHWMLNAERVFKRDFANHKFMGFDLMARTIDSVSAMLAAAPKQEVQP